MADGKGGVATVVNLRAGPREIEMRLALKTTKKIIGLPNCFLLLSTTKKNSIEVLCKFRA
jgi:hypothetical protein